MIKKILGLFTTQKVIVTVNGSDYAESIEYLKYQLDGRPCGGGNKDDNLIPIKVTKFEVLEKSPLKALIHCSKKYQLNDYLLLNDITLEVLK